MQNSELKQIIDEQVLNDETKNALVEAWDKKLNEARQEIEEQVRNEFAQRYENDKAKLVDTMDQFLNEHIRNELSEFSNDRKEVREKKKELDRQIKENKKKYQKALNEKEQKLKEFVLSQLNKELKEFNSEYKALQDERVRLSKAIAEAKQNYKQKLQENTKVLSKFVADKLNEELSEFNQDKKQLANERKQAIKELKEAKAEAKKNYQNRIQKLEEFVINKLDKELKEFEHDKQELTERRVQLEKESKKKLEETKQQFVKRASKLVEQQVLDSLKGEMRQLKGDLKEARKQHFGRKLFEAFSEEFMSSYLSEGTEVKKTQKQLQEERKRAKQIQQQLDEKEKQIQSAQRKLRLAEERAERNDKLNKLLQPLPKNQREVMSSLLENVKTEKLDESFKKFLPQVMNEDNTKGKSNINSGKIKNDDKARVLKEEKSDKNKASNKENSKTTVTGDKENLLSEATEEEKKVNQSSGEVFELAKLAGIN